MPPFQSRSTGALSTADISSLGASDLTPSSSPSTARTCGVISMDLALRGCTPPPLLISLAS